MVTRRQFMQRAAGAAATAVLTPVINACSGGSTSQPDYSASIAAMKPYIQQQMTDNQVTGLAVLLVDDQRTAWAQGFGYADLANQRPATADTLFEIGSNSKTFTGTMVMQLADRGRINIDAPVTTYLPQFSIGQPLGSFSAGGGAITPRTMMNHHSGIPGDFFNGAFTANVGNRNLNSRLMTLLSSDYADYPVNFLWAYSNTAVSLLGDVIAAASGQTFEQYSNQLFATLGMTHSTFYPDFAVADSNRSKGYINNQEYGPFYCNIPASGSILSNTADMAKYLKMVLAGGMGENGRVLRQETLEAMLTATNTSVPLDLDFHMGLSWILSDPELAYAGKICWHNGGTMLMMSHMEVLRDQQLAAMVMTNSKTGAGAAANIAKQLLKVALQEKARISPPSPPVPAFSPIVTWTPAQLDAVAGLYVASSGYDLVARNGTGLSWTATANVSPVPAPVQLVPRANGWFSPSDSQQAQYEFTTISGRDVMVKHSADGTRSLLGERYVPQAIPPAWSARVGQYEATDLDPNDATRFMPPDTAPVVTVQDGILLIANWVVAPLSDTLGYMRGLGRNLGGSVQIINVNGEEQMQLLDGRYRKTA